MKYEWRRMLLVEVDSDLPDDSEDFVAGAGEEMRVTKTEAKVSLRVSQYEVAESKGGRKVHRCNDGSGTVMEGLPETGARQSDSWTESDMRALVPDTKENRQAIQSVIDGFGKLRDKLATLLSPEKIEKSLVQINAGMKLLEGPQRGSAA
jgi:hypothetical protein